MDPHAQSFVAFEGYRRIGRGELAEVAEIARARLDAAGNDRIALYDEFSGQPVDVDMRGSPSEVRARVAAEQAAAREAFVPAPPPATVAPAAPRGPGRPRLGVVSREVSLLPRHWAWLGSQRGGASATLRRLVDAERKVSQARDVTRQAIEAAHRFLWDLAGDLPDFEEATRALFAADFAALELRTRAWPCDVREQLLRFVERARPSVP